MRDAGGLAHFAGGCIRQAPQAYGRLPPPARPEKCLTPLPKSIAQKIIELGNVVDLLDGFIERILDTLKTQGARRLASAAGSGRMLELPAATTVEHHVAGGRVAVARLADRADIDHRFFVGQTVFVSDLFGAEEVQA